MEVIILLSPRKLVAAMLDIQPVFVQKMSKASSFYCEYEYGLVTIVVSEHNISKSSYVSFSLLVWAKQGILSKNYPKIGKMSFLHYRLDI